MRNGGGSGGGGAAEVVGGDVWCGWRMDWVFLLVGGDYRIERGKGEGGGWYAHGSLEEWSGVDLGFRYWIYIERNECLWYGIVNRYSVR